MHVSCVYKSAAVCLLAEVLQRTEPHAGVGSATPLPNKLDVSALSLLYILHQAAMEADVERWIWR